MKPLLVVAGVIEREGLILICQRRAGDKHALKWEFPGGKVEPDEEPREALRRELREELDIDAVIGAEMARYEHQYSGRPRIQLVFFRVDSYTGVLRNRVFETTQWAPRAVLPSIDFLDGDIDFVRRLAAGL